jgi:tetratricopeptide (TPR) repeat protein
MKDVAERPGGEIAPRGYSEDEVAHIYELGRFHLENGDTRRAEAIMTGLNEVAPNFAPAWLGTSYLNILNRSYDTALAAARSALRINPEMPEALLYLVACLLTTGDVQSAGTYLGEIGERIESGAIDRPDLIRFYRGQLARFQSR